MVTLTLNAAQPKIFSLPTREDVRRMFSDRAVAITAIVFGSLLTAFFVACVTFLAYTGKGAEALTGAGAIAFLAAVVSIMQRLKRVEQHVTPTDGGGSSGQ